MSITTQPPDVIELPEPTQAQPPRLERPARALVGWMQPDQLALHLCGKRMNEQPSEDQIEQSAKARSTVLGRPEATPAESVFLETPDKLREYEARLQLNAIARQYFAEGWRVAVADLTKVRAFQPAVFTEQAVERVSGVDEKDVLALAELSLPMVEKLDFPLQFDEAKNAWIITSPDLNLRVFGHFAGPVAGGEDGPPVPAVGFIAGALPSMMKVVEFDGRHYLTDGYHRAFGFLSRGITHVPVMTRQIDQFEELGLPVGMLPQGAYLGTRPPHLPDYLDDAVSATVMLPIAQKVIVIQALELTPTG